ncbi:Uncharacterised protein [Serratia rubidaea]|uniref:Uncharacterized protein n=1 Tax=Serratia rubidaea TaxID=61652 RepID=A0A4U9HH41_SERRU|nr:Uncharacterised protein [Serratia rubidaea]
MLLAEIDQIDLTRFYRLPADAVNQQGDHGQQQQAAENKAPLVR